MSNNPNAGPKINNLTLNINNNTSININNNPFNIAHQNHQNNQHGPINQPMMKPFVPFQMGVNPNLNNKNMLNFPIFNPILSQQKPKPTNIFPYNPKMNTYQRFSLPDNNNNLNNMNNNINNNITSNILSSNEDRIFKLMDGAPVTELLRDYINRAYQKCNDITEKNQMDKFLKKIVNLAKFQNDISTRDWKNHPLPSLPRERIEIKKENENLLNDDQNESLCKIIKKIKSFKFYIYYLYIIS